MYFFLQKDIMSSSAQAIKNSPCILLQPDYYSITPLLPGVSKSSRQDINYSFDTEWSHSSAGAYPQPYYPYMLGKYI